MSRVYKFEVMLNTIFKQKLDCDKTLLLPEACSLAQVCSADLKLVVVVVVEEAAALEVAAQTVLAAAVAVVRVVVVAVAAVVVVVGSHLVFCYHAGLRQLDGLHFVYEEKIFK